MDNGELFLGWLFFGALFFVMAELFGRSKHIGRYWSWALLWGCFVIPGIIAIIASPSAKKDPTKPNWIYQVFGFVFSLIALAFLIALINEYSELTFWSSNGKRMLIRMQLAQMIGFVVLGVYFIYLSLGKVINDNPKFYFEKINFSLPSLNSKEKSVLRYHIVIDGAKSGPFSLEELKAKFIDPSTLVWRYGLDTWKQASELTEFKDFLNYEPPPVPNSEDVKREFNEVPIIVEDKVNSDISSENLLTTVENAISSDSNNLNNTVRWILYTVILCFIFLGLLKQCNYANDFEIEGSVERSVMDYRDNFYTPGLRRHIDANFQYPQELRYMGVEGKIIMGFELDTAGMVIQVFRKDVCQSCDELANEAERVLLLYKGGIPLIKDGQKRKQKFEIPFNCHLE